MASPLRSDVPRTAAVHNELRAAAQRPANGAAETPVRATTGNAAAGCRVPGAAAAQARASSSNTQIHDFLGDVKQDLIRNPDQAGYLSFSVTRSWALSAESLLGSLSLGSVRLKAGRTFKAVTDEARARVGSCRERDFSYSLQHLRVSRQKSCKADEQEAEGRPVDVCFDGVERSLQLRVPLPLGTDRLDLGTFMHVLNAWASTATKALAGAVSGTALTSALSGLLVPTATGCTLAAMPLKLAGFDLASFGSGAVFSADFWGTVAKDIVVSGPGAAELALKTHVGLFSLTSAIMFISSIRGLNKHSTAKQGNYMGILATALGIISVLASPAFAGAHARFFVTFFLASIVGFTAAGLVSMEEMPELVAGFHSLVGLAAVFVGYANFFHGGDFSRLKAMETFLGTAVGSLTYTGSIVAAGKLHGWIPGRPIILPVRWTLNAACFVTSATLALAFTTPSIYASNWGTVALIANTKIWGILGANMVLPIGGADMPVVVSLLNAFSGLATSAVGFMLSNNLLTISGALITSSGTLLSDIMCRGINRSMINVLLGGFGVDETSASSAVAPTGTIQEVTALGFLGMLIQAKRIMIVPGYGMAVARCQNRLAEIVALLRSKGVVVHFAIHPVAGRLPGHMNVLLAEANVPYDIVKEMEDVNKDLPRYDVAIVLGANDIVNPATQTDTSSPIYGMPAIEVWEAKTVVVMKRSMATGYSGVDNPLFYRENVRMLFGDAKATIDNIHQLLEESQDQIHGQAGGIEEAAEVGDADDQQDYPEAKLSIGIIRERRAGEQRVSVPPSVVPKLRKMGFSILLEAGAGVAAGFADDDYMKKGASGGVQIAESSMEVLQQADIVLKVNEPLLDEVQSMKKTQTMVAFWNMFGQEDLLSALEKSPATFVNLSLVPRVSRAQKMDALTSMANIAGYRAVLDAFNRLPRFSRSSVSAAGTVPPAKVFVIGAGIAGLSAIATAHAMGSKVLGNDVRDAARDQVTGLGGEFVAIDAESIAGEGVGGYASEMSQDFKQRQLATYARIVKDCDVVISTAMIPNRPAPVVITEAMVKSMRKGSVIVDLAAATGGNCALSQLDQTVVAHGVTILAPGNYPSTMAGVASDMIGNNFAALLETLGGAAEFGGDHWEDPVIMPATVVRGGRFIFNTIPPPAPAPPPGPQAPVPVVPSQQEVNVVIQYLEAHKEELAWAVGLSTVIGLGLVADIPEEEVTHMGYFVLSLLIGHFTVSGVTPALHTPLVAVTNAISGIIVVGGMLQLQGELMTAKVACALAAVFLSSINIVGGFAVTHRMLEMFKGDDSQAEKKSGGH